MSTSRAVALLTSAVVLALPAAAQAKLPSPKSKTIVFGKSIGGVKLGMSLAAAKKAWGKGGKCADTSAQIRQTRCDWLDKKNGDANFTVSNGRVTYIGLSPAVSSKTQKAKLSGPIAKFRTSKHIGMGSTLKALRKAYPKARDGAADTLAIRSGDVTTAFGNQGGRIAGISISTPA